MKENNLITKFANQDGEKITTKLSNANTVTNNLTVLDNFKIKQAPRQINAILLHSFKENKCNFILCLKKSRTRGYKTPVLVKGTVVTN